MTTQSILFDPNPSIHIKAKLPVHQVICQICDWKGLWSECEKDDKRYLHCPNCQATNLRDRDETEQYEGDAAKEVAKLRKRYASEAHL